MYIAYECSGARADCRCLACPLGYPCADSAAVGGSSQTSCEPLAGIWKRCAVEKNSGALLPLEAMRKMLLEPTSPPSPPPPSPPPVL